MQFKRTLYISSSKNKKQGLLHNPKIRKCDSYISCTSCQRSKYSYIIWRETLMALKGFACSTSPPPAKKWSNYYIGFFFPKPSDRKFTKLHTLTCMFTLELFTTRMTQMWDKVEKAELLARLLKTVARRQVISFQIFRGFFLSGELELLQTLPILGAVVIT